MSRKILKMNAFGESILDEYELFFYKLKNVHQKYPKNENNNPDVYQIEFDWEWNGYSGYGEIDFYKSTNKLCNEFGENMSNMTVSSKSKKQQPNCRNNCALYNNPSLEELFTKMINDFDTSKALSHDEWLNL